MLKMRFALERVENTCYSVDRKWYHPVIFNMTNSTEFHGLGKAALCPSNFSDPQHVEDDLEKSSFLASDVAGTNIWNASELRVGRDVEQTEETFPLTEIGDLSIGSSQNYSFLAVNFDRDSLVEGSWKALSGRSNEKKPRAFHTASFTVGNGTTLECLMIVRWQKDEETGELEMGNFTPEVCLVPIANNRVVLGLFDDIEAGNGFQLVMSVAVDSVQSFKDLRILRFLPWMVGQNNGMHTYRELGILAVLSGRMIENISVDGYHSLRIEVGIENITVPTLNVWGIVLLFCGTLFFLIAKFVLGRSRKRMNLKGDLGTVRGIAEHWLQYNEGLEDLNREMGRVVLVLEDGSETMPGIVNVKREFDVRRKVESFTTDREQALNGL
ncbi:hypothetical protein FGB62_137g29 [Gracilaria domingensis]|nr:hypothetical protein FGB62_137g29 [Gracilaria domingensis]